METFQKLKIYFKLNLDERNKKDGYSIWSEISYFHIPSKEVVINQEPTEDLINGSQVMKSYCMNKCLGQ